MRHSPEVRGFGVKFQFAKVILPSLNFSAQLDVLLAVYPESDVFENALEDKKHVYTKPSSKNSSLH